MKFSIHKYLPFLFIIFVFHTSYDSYAVNPFWEMEGYGIVYDAEYSPDGAMIAVALSKGFQILDAITFKQLHMENTESEVRLVKWLSDSERVLIIFDSFTDETIMNISTKLSVFNVKSMSIEQELNVHIRWMISPFGFNENVSYNIKSNSEPPLLHKNSIGMSINSPFLSVINDINKVQIIDTRTWQSMYEIEIPTKPISAATRSQSSIFSTGISNDGSILWVGTDSNEIYIYSLNSFELLNTFAVNESINRQTFVIKYSYEKDYAISINPFHTGSSIVNEMFYHDTSRDYLNVIVKKIAQSNSGTISFTSAQNIIVQTDEGKILVLEIGLYNSSFFSKKVSLNEIRVIDKFYIESEMIKEKYFETYFSYPFSPDGKTMLTTGYFERFKNTPDLLSIGALSEQPTIRLLPLKPEPSVFDFHSTIPNTLLTYSTNQNASGEDILELWDIPSKSLITSVSKVNMYELGTYSPDGKYFASLDQPYQSNTAKNNIFYSTTVRRKVNENGLTPLKI